MIAFLGNCFSDWPKNRFIGLYKWCEIVHWLCTISEPDDRSLGSLED